MWLFKTIDQINNVVRLVQGDGRSYGQAQLMIGNVFRNRQSHPIPYLVAFLLVGGDGIMNDGSHAVLFKIIMQCIALLAKDGEEMVHILAVSQAVGKSNQRMFDVVVIIIGNQLPMCVIVNQVLQLHIQHCCLDFIQTAVAASIFEDILFERTVIGQSTNCVCQDFIIRCDRTAITQSANVLARIERMTCCIANTTCYTTISVFATVSLSVILN